MAICPPFDTATRISAELSAFIEKLAADLGGEEPFSLGAVREALRAPEPGEEREPGLLCPHERTSLALELEELIGEFGPEAPATDFVPARPSEALSRVIEAAMKDPALPEDPTLGLVREAIAGGFTARLIARGALDPEEDGTLLAELDALIAQRGADAPAESFVRLE